MQGLSAFGNGIYAVESGYNGPDVAAIHLIESEGRVAFVDAANGRWSSAAKGLAAQLAAAARSLR